MDSVKNQITAIRSILESDKKSVSEEDKQAILESLDIIEDTFIENTGDVPEEFVNVDQTCNWLFDEGEFTDELEYELRTTLNKLESTL